MEKTKIAVVGWYNHGNCGDESYKLSFPLVFPSYDFVFSERPVKGAAAHILGGGDIVCDTMLAALERESPKHIMSATLSGAKDLGGYATIALRDHRSIYIAKTGGIKAQYAPDFAFALGHDAANGRRIIEKKFNDAKAELYSKVVVVVVNAHLSGDHQQSARHQCLFQHLSYELAKACDSVYASFLFVPFSVQSPWDDRVAGSWVASKCKWWKKNAVVYDSLGVQDTIDVIAAADAVVSTRLHSSIFSCLTATPFVDVTHNHKNDGLLETLGLRELSVPYTGFDCTKFVDKLNQFLTEGTRVKDNLSKATEKQKSILREFAKNVRLV